MKICSDSMGTESCVSSIILYWNPFHSIAPFFLHSLSLSCPSVSPWRSDEDIPYIWFLFLHSSAIHLHCKTHVHSFSPIVLIIQNPFFYLMLKYEPDMFLTTLMSFIHAVATKHHSHVGMHRNFGYRKFSAGIAIFGLRPKSVIESDVQFVLLQRHVLTVFSVYLMHTTWISYNS